MTRRHWIGAAVLAALLVPWLVDVLVVTDEEAIRAALDEFAADTEAMELDGMFALLAGDFASEAPLFRERSAAEWRARTASFFQTLDQVRVDLERVDVQVEGDDAQSAVRGFLMVRGPQGGAPWQVQADLRWRREPDGWKVTRLVRLDARVGVF